MQSLKHIWGLRPMVFRAVILLKFLWSYWPTGQPTWLLRKLQRFWTKVKPVIPQVNSQKLFNLAPHHVSRWNNFANFLRYFDVKWIATWMFCVKRMGSHSIRGARAHSWICSRKSTSADPQRTDLYRAQVCCLAAAEFGVGVGQVPVVSKAKMCRLPELRNVLVTDTRL
jgi:hypothetical protein